MQIKQVFSTYSAKDKAHHGQFVFYPFCGSRLVLKEKGGRQRPACSQCGFVQFQNPVPGVVVVIEKNGNVLLGKRLGSYGKGKWGLPQGYIEYDEDFLTAALRETKEETGLDVEISSIINVVSNFLSPKLHTLAIILLAVVKAGEICAADDLETLEWFPLADPLPEMAFEADEFILRRVQKANIDERLPVDPCFAVNNG